MKKFFIVFVIFILLLLAFIYFFIPAKLEISKVEYANCNINGASRTLHNFHAWKKWWPAENTQSPANNNSNNLWYYYNGYNYHLNEKLYDAIKIYIKDDLGNETESTITIIKINPDSVAMLWKCILPASMNPFKRISKYMKAETIHKNMTQILSGLSSFLNNKDNIYGIHLHIVMSNDSTLVATKSITKNYPTTQFIYQLIEDLKKYIKKEDAKENNFPMLNIRKTEDLKYETMVAIPVNKQLKGEGKIFFSRFVPWKVLTAEVSGGNYTVEKALHQMKVYISDYQITSMAIPFQLLVTNRINQPDTLKWITEIYTPVP